MPLTRPSATLSPQAGRGATRTSIEICCPSPRLRGEGARRADEGRVIVVQRLLERRHRAGDDDGLVARSTEHRSGRVIAPRFDFENQLLDRPNLVRQRGLGELLCRAADAVVGIIEAFEANGDGMTRIDGRAAKAGKSEPVRGGGAGPLLMSGSQ